MPCCPCDLATVLVVLCLDEWCLALEAECDLAELEAEVWVLEDCNCLGFGLLEVVLVVVAVAAPVRSNDRQNTPTDCKLRFLLTNNHPYDKSMNSRITCHCNEAFAKRKQKNDPGSQKRTVAASGNVAITMPEAPR